MTRSIKWLMPVLAAVLCSIVGCSDDATPVAAEKKGTARPKANKECFLPSPVNSVIKSTNVILRVNGVEFTRAQYDQMYRIREKVFRRANGIAMNEKSDKVRRYMVAGKYDILGIFIRRELMRQAAERRGLKATDELFSEIAARFLRQIRSSRQGLEKAMGSFLTPEEAAVQMAGMECDALGEAYLRSWATNDMVNVSDVEVSNRVVKINEINVETKRLNDEARRKAAAAKAEIMAGGNFYAVTTNRCELVPEQGKEWETFELGELEPEEDLFKFLSTANQGDISDPLDFDDGIGIVGVLLKEKGEAPAGYAAADQYTCVRCLFTAYTPIELPADMEDLRQTILDDRRSKARVAMGEELMKTAVIEYPSGEQIFKVKSHKAKPGKNKGKNKVNKGKKGQK